jgi:hypothetical protein
MALTSATAIARKPFPIPVVRAEDFIPFGPYCYTAVAAPSETNNFVYQTKPCRFLKVKPEHPSQVDGWCDYLNTGDMVEGGTDLLWDAVKGCGIKTEDDPLEGFRST